MPLLALWSNGRGWFLMRNVTSRRVSNAHCSFCSNFSLSGLSFILTFLDEGFDVLIEAQSMAFPPQTHVGWVILPAAFVRGAHGEQLPPVPGQQQLLLPAGQVAPAGPQRQAVVGDVDKAGVLAAAGKASAPVPVPPGVSLVPVVGAHRHGQHAQGAERKREPGVEQQLPGSHARFCHSRISTSTDGQLLCGFPASSAHITSGERRQDHYPGGGLGADERQTRPLTQLTGRSRRWILVFRCFWLQSDNVFPACSALQQLGGDRGRLSHLSPGSSAHIRLSRATRTEHISTAFGSLVKHTQ